MNVLLYEPHRLLNTRSGAMWYVISPSGHASVTVHDTLSPSGVKQTVCACRLRFICLQMMVHDNIKPVPNACSKGSDNKDSD